MDGCTFPKQARILANPRHGNPLVPIAPHAVRLLGHYRRTSRERMGAGRELDPLQPRADGEAGAAGWKRKFLSVCVRGKPGCGDVYRRPCAFPDREAPREPPPQAPPPQTPHAQTSERFTEAKVPAGGLPLATESCYVVPIAGLSLCARRGQGAKSVFRGDRPKPLSRPGICPE
jgi:hypothetical protein